MEKKMSWNTIDENVKKKLLYYWFHYYGGEIYTLRDLENYEELLEKEYDNIFKSIVATYITKDTIQSSYLLNCMRLNKIQELFEHLPKIEEMTSGEQEIYNTIELMVLNEIVNSYINKEPDIALSEEEIIKQINKLR